MNPILRFLPDNRGVEIAEAMPLGDAAAEAGILIEQPCGGKGECANCRVRFVEGAPDPTAADRAQLAPEDLAAGWRLSCQTIVERAAVVEVPASERLPDTKSFGPADLFAGESFEPVVRAVEVDVPRATVAEPFSDWDALERAVPATTGAARACHLTGSLAAIGRLRAALVESGANRRGVALIEGDRLIDFAKAARPLGIAADLGSTTVAAALVDLRDGSVLTTAADLNPQVRFGSDVMARIQHAMRGPDAASDLTRAARDVLARLAREACAKAGVEPGTVAAATICGNPTMLHLFVGADARPLGEAPYTGVFTHDLSLDARAACGLPLHPEARVWVFPQVQCSVGGDSTAAAIATDLDRAERPRLLIDLGTNSEILLGCRDWMLAASTAAGPAFEGGNVTHGMRAAPGAIDRVTLARSGRLLVHVLGGRERARGVCGSGLVDALVAMLEAEAVDFTGRMTAREDYAGPSEDVRERLVKTRSGRNAVMLTRESEGEDGRAVLMTDDDVRALQLVKGSILAGALVLMEEARIGPDDLEGVYLAGAFGNFLRKRSVLRIGLVPEVNAERVHFVGNAAGVGARMALVDRRARDRAIAIGRRCRYVEMAAHSAFPETFALSMSFPESR